MFCAKCGKEAEDNIKFCSSCGNQLAGNPEQINPSATSAPVNIVGKVKVQKDIGVAIILAFIFGPVGVFYVSLKGALILLSAFSASVIATLITQDAVLKTITSQPFLGPRVEPDLSLLYFFGGVSLIIFFVVSPIFAYKTAKKTHEIDTIPNNTITKEVGLVPTSTNFTEEASVSVSKSKSKILFISVVVLVIGALLIFLVNSSKNTSTDYSAQVTSPVIESQSNATPQLEGAVKADEYYENSNSSNNKEQVEAAILDGKYLANGDGSKNELQVKKLGVGQIKFSISTEGVSVDEMGSRCVGSIDDSVAKIKGNVATFTGEDGCILVMDFKGDNVEAMEHNCSSYHGAQCTFDGTYSNTSQSISSGSQSTKSIDAAKSSATDNVAMSLVLKLLDYAMIDGGIKNESQMQEIISQLNVQWPQSDKKVARKLNDEALVFFKNNDLDNAEKTFAKALDANPYDAEISNNIGFMLLKQKSFNDAKTSLLYTLALAPNRANAWMNLGDVFANLGDLNKAVASFSNTFRFSKNKMKTLRLMKKLNENEDVALLKQARELAKVWAVKNYPAELQL